jgi:hypothetical protein
VLVIVDNDVIEVIDGARWRASGLVAAAAALRGADGTYPVISIAQKKLWNGKNTAKYILLTQI